MDDQSFDDLTTEQIHYFMRTLKDLHLKNPSLFQMDDIDSLKQRFQEMLKLIRNMKHHDISELLESLRRNFEENHVNYHRLSSLAILFNEISDGLSEKSRDQYEIMMMERLGLPWERPLIQELKNRFPSATILEIPPNINNFAELKRKSRNATLSITTADLIVSNAGSIILIDRNRVRGVLTTTSKRHVVIVPVTRVIFSHDEVIELVGKILRLRTGKVDAHVHVISNPSRTGDIEKIIVYGAHGPLALDVYLLDVENGFELANDDLLMLKRYSGLLEFVLIQAFPWLNETLQVLEIPCFDVISIFWFLELHDRRKYLQYLFLLKFLRRFLISNDFSVKGDLLQEIVDFCHEIITKNLETRGMSLQLVLEEVEGRLEMFFNEVFAK